MPFYTREMVRFGKERPYIQRQNFKTAQSTRCQRVCPSHVDQVDVSKFEVNSTKVIFTDKTLYGMRVLLCQQVDKIKQMPPSTPSSSKVFSKYQLAIDDEPMQTCPMYKMYSAKLSTNDEWPMVVKVFDKMDQWLTKPNYLKILRHIGKVHVNIVQTWDIFHDQNKHTLIIQEYVYGADLATIAKQTLQPETQVRQWARQLYSALDHLGDMAICHRALKPTNVLISQFEWTIKLTEFHNSIVYWNAQTEDINYLPCLSLSCKSQVSPDFEALEVYGDAEKEQFDPIMADIWAYGAVLYFAASQGNYPFNCALDNPKVEQEIQANVDKLPLSEQAKAYLEALLQTNALARIPFGQIGRHGWLALHYICDL